MRPRSRAELCVIYGVAAELRRIVGEPAVEAIDQEELGLAARSTLKVVSGASEMSGTAEKWPFGA
jgi:hypothetical protein